ncbi:sulfate ABC transporter ATP-binding protein [Mangrovactinospora gilvigrisea]|uniref:Sulfate ABC transporter ATP-binding protein n=1 Tax=Mangrovactinospora gilvigrisea TaxID=1428644 RepID=A0A1J7BA43_9ACTN|nr:ABC transporter ATP-binding protein [Mangrovactinospora gilvigrisea]OIV35478.1 sulfate ABC transporter ATP-binding protein [Mangrovactinospora gilvigrisea]
MSAAISLESVSKRFAPAAPPVLADVDLRIAPGEFVCLLGASGCGKSTLLNLVAGLEAPSAGRVRVPAGRTAVMFQDHALFPWLTAGGNVQLALKARGVPRAERRAEAERLLALVRLPGRHDARVHALSGGMRQRVALARALAQDASVLLMDEPFAALDAITRDHLYAELTRIRLALGLTVVFVTHNAREAVRLGDRVVLLAARPGRIAREWTVDLPHPRRIESAAVAGLSAEIIDRLGEEVAGADV